jgi:16S rRNA (adenine1518-N6/adenine1519-N6)-dimethyltransferase
VNLLEETKLILRRHGFKPKRSAGQNFLIDEEVLERQVGYADIKMDEVVLEVGAGIGNLTRYLVERAGRVIAVEKDPILVRILGKRLRGWENLELLQGDVLKLRLPSYDKVVSNIPYSISSPLTFKFFRAGFKKAVITYQREFAERMVASPGSRSYSRLSVATYYYADAAILELISPGAFYPEPEVSSAMVELAPKKPPFDVPEELFLEVLKALFTHRGKTVRSAFLHSALLSRNKAERRKILERLDETLLGKRVFDLKPREIASLTKALEEVLG